MYTSFEFYFIYLRFFFISQSYNFGKGWVTMYRKYSLGVSKLCRRYGRKIVTHYTNFPNSQSIRGCCEGGFRMKNGPFNYGSRNITWLSKTKRKTKTCDRYFSNWYKIFKSQKTSENLKKKNYDKTQIFLLDNFWWMILVFVFSIYISITYPGYDRDSW